MKQVKFSRQTSFTGRNGEFVATGVDFEPTKRGVMIAPITSKGTIGRCDITIPLEDIPAFIEALKSVINDQDQAEPGPYEPQDLTVIASFSRDQISETAQDLITGPEPIYRDMVLKEDLYDIDRALDYALEEATETEIPADVTAELEAIRQKLAEHDAAYIRFID